MTVKGGEFLYIIPDMVNNTLKPIRLIYVYLSYTFIHRWFNNTRQPIDQIPSFIVWKYSADDGHLSAGLYKFLLLLFFFFGCTIISVNGLSFRLTRTSVPLLLLRVPRSAQWKPYVFLYFPVKIFFVQDLFFLRYIFCFPILVHYSQFQNFSLVSNCSFLTNVKIPRKFLTAKFSRHDLFYRVTSGRQLKKPNHS